MGDDGRSVLASCSSSARTSAARARTAVALAGLSVSAHSRNIEEGAPSVDGGPTVMKPCVSVEAPGLVAAVPLAAAAARRLSSVVRPEAETISGDRDISSVREVTSVEAASAAQAMCPCPCGPGAASSAVARRASTLSLRSVAAPGGSVVTSSAGQGSVASGVGAAAPAPAGLGSELGRGLPCSPPVEAGGAAAPSAGAAFPVVFTAPFTAPFTACGRLHKKGWVVICSTVMRCSGLGCMAASRSAAAAAVQATGGRGGPLAASTALRSSGTVAPLKGTRPKSSSKRQTPTDHTSAAAPYGCPRRASGAMYSGEPQTVRAIDDGSSARASPKSAMSSRAVRAESGGGSGAAAAAAASAATPFPKVRSKLCGLMSRWSSLRTRR